MEVTRLLIECGARVDLCARDGLSPLMIAAAQNPNPQITQLLFDEGGDPYSPKRDGWTVLMLKMPVSSWRVRDR